MRVDLHIHSTASDGALPPEAVVRRASAGGLDVIALADHDTTAGYEEAAATGHEVDVQVVPALEVSSTFQGRDVHILGYFVDPDCGRRDVPGVKRAGFFPGAARVAVGNVGQQGAAFHSLQGVGFVNKHAAGTGPGN